MFSAPEISKISEVEVFKGVYYDAQKKPIVNGLLDPKMVRFLSCFMLFATYFGFIFVVNCHLRNC